MMFCKTKQAMLFLGVEDAKGLLRFPSQPLVCDVAPRKPVIELFVDYARRVVNAELRAIDVHYWHQFAEDMPSGETLFVGRVVPQQVEFQEDAWVTMPEWIRSLPKDRNRLPWLKAWQVYAGGYDQECRAVEADDAELNSLPRSEP